MSLFPDTEPDTTYEVLARKYRPRNFDDLLGHEAMVRTLQNAFEAGRIAHAYILTGVRGVGKTTTARILARALNYHLPDGPDKPQIEMPEDGIHCRAIAEGRHQDVIEMDAASRTGVGDIRELIESVRYAPVEARFKVYIIDEVHMLSNSAFNALLKTLEEPPPHVKFIFATTEIRKLPVTVLSRCQRFDLRRFDGETLSAYLGKIAAKEGVSIAQEGLALIARAAEGSVRDALSLLDQAIVQETDKSTEIRAACIKDMLGLADRSSVWALLASCLKGDTPAALTYFRGQYDAGTDPAVIVRDLLEVTHLLTRIKAAGAAAADTGVAGAAEVMQAVELASRVEMNVLTRCWTLLMQGLNEVQTAPDRVAAAEMALIRLCYAAELPTPDEALRLLKSLGTDKNAVKDMPVNEKNTTTTPSVSVSSKTQREDRRENQSALDQNSSFGVGNRSSDSKNADKIPQYTENITQLPVVKPLHNSKKEPAFSAITTLEGLVHLAGHHRDGILREEIEKFVSVISITPGRLEFFPLPGAPQGFEGKLKKSILAWTQEHWEIVVNRKTPGADTIRARRNAKIKAHPLVKAVKEAYPMLDIDKNIRIKEIAVPQPENHALEADTSHEFLSHDPAPPEAEHRRQV